MSHFLRGKHQCFVSSFFLRLASCLFYLNDDFEGGATHFLEIDLTVKPVKGSCLLWFNCRLPIEVNGIGSTDNPNSTPSPSIIPNVMTTHAGLPVVSGVKFAANKWIHATNYRQIE